MKTSNLTRLYLIMSVVGGPIFLGPVILIALVKLAHMSVEQIFISEALATALILVLDAPSGILADMIGRKRCVILGRTILLISSIIIACMSTPLHGILANLLWAVSISLCSGAESALIYDELSRRNALDVYPSLMKKVHSYGFLAAALATLASGFLAEISLRLPLILSVPGVAVGVTLLFFFPQEEKIKKTHSWHAYKEHTKEAVKEVWNHTYLRTIMLWFALLSLVGKIYFFTYNPYLEHVHVPYSTVGMIFFGINMMSYFASRYAFTVYENSGKISFWFGFCSQGVMMLVQAIVARPWCGWIFSLQGLTRGYFNTVEQAVLNKEIKKKKRATVLSFQSSFENLIRAVVFVIISPISNNPILLMMLLGVTSLILGFYSRRL